MINKSERKMKLMKREGLPMKNGAIVLLASGILLGGGFALSAVAAKRSETVFGTIQATGLSAVEETKGGRVCRNTDATPDTPGGGWTTFEITVENATLPIRIEIDAWGESSLDYISVNTCGTGKSTRNGGVWTKIRPNQKISGQEQWDTLVFEVPVKALVPGKNQQVFGVGGGDKSALIADIRVIQ